MQTKLQPRLQLILNSLISLLALPAPACYLVPEIIYLQRQEVTQGGLCCFLIPRILERAGARRVFGKSEVRRLLPMKEKGRKGEKIQSVN